MFLRCKTRKKDGKTHRYWNVVENCRRKGGGIVQRHVLYLGEINDVYNWWSLSIRLASPEARREAITSRPWLMSSMGYRTKHAGQTTLTLTGLHAHLGKAWAALMRISALLQGWVAQAAEQLNSITA